MLKKVIFICRKAASIRPMSLRLVISKSPGELVPQRPSVTHSAAVWPRSPAEPDGSARSRQRIFACVGALPVLGMLGFLASPFVFGWGTPGYAIAATISATLVVGASQLAAKLRP